MPCTGCQQRRVILAAAARAALRGGAGEAVRRLSTVGLSLLSDVQERALLAQQRLEDLMRQRLDRTGGG
jgi:hypothetical protein